MEKEDIIRMAREAWNEAGEGWVVEGWFKDREKAFERFAQLVAAAEREKHRSYIHELELELETTQDRLNEFLVADYMKARRQQ